MNLMQHAPAASRNREPIREVLAQILPPKGIVLETASGSGEHAVYFAKAFPQLQWQPSDRDAAARHSIEAFREEAQLPNLLPAIELDVMQDLWPVKRADAVVCINMIHIAPWTATLALFRGAARVLNGGPLYLYGPYFVAGKAAAPSNIAFDESLRARNAQWAVRHLDDVTSAAESENFVLERVVEMPANNLSVIFRERRA